MKATICWMLIIYQALCMWFFNELSTLPHSFPTGYLHFTVEESEAQRLSFMLQLKSWSVVEAGTSNPEQLYFQTLGGFYYSLLIRGYRVKRKSVVIQKKKKVRLFCSLWGKKEYQKDISLEYGKIWSCGFSVSNSFPAVSWNQTNYSRVFCFNVSGGVTFPFSFMLSCLSLAFFALLIFCHVHKSFCASGSPGSGVTCRQGGSPGW
jgi:hypothetical protein